VIVQRTSSSDSSKRLVPKRTRSWSSTSKIFFSLSMASPRDRSFETSAATPAVSSLDSIQVSAALHLHRGIRHDGHTPVAVVIHAVGCRTSDRDAAAPCLEFDRTLVNRNTQKIIGRWLPTVVTAQTTSIESNLNNSFGDATMNSIKFNKRIGGNKQLG